MDAQNTAAIEAVWTLAIGYLVPAGLLTASPFALAWLGRWMLRRSSGDGFAYDFIPLAADVHDDVVLLTDRL